MRRTDAYLMDMADAAGRIAEYISGMSRASFLRDDKTKAAVVRET
jgi:uncharacterized protein with HEPN domain